jgi:ABC-type amino acid transport substrate-binding protein
VKASVLPTLAVAFTCFACAAAEGAENDNEGTLRVCLNESVPPYSVRHGGAGTGFDLLVAEAVAKRLGQNLAVQWFESKLDLDSSSAIEANALLSDRRCDLLAGYPLVKDGLGKPGAETGRMPGFAGSTPADRRRRVTLGTLTPTRPYHFAGLAVVVDGKAVDKPIAKLGDLSGLKLGVEGGTLADAILMNFDHGRLIPDITHLVPGRGELLPRLESGDYEATLIPAHRFDAYRVGHPDTRLRLSGYYLPVGFNMGFVGLASDAGLIDRVNAALEGMLKDGEAESLAVAAQMTYLPPRQPYILDGLRIGDLTKFE